MYCITFGQLIVIIIILIILTPVFMMVPAGGALYGFAYTAVVVWWLLGFIIACQE